ncbi:MAG: hypothetical protein LUO98_03200, partial [Methanoregula sp.]|nr:hypothetical protein [Methanoregula sp.]
MRGRERGGGLQPGLGVMTVAERPACAQCGKEAIGVQSFGCRTSCACRDHAHSLLLSLEPG